MDKKLDTVIAGILKIPETEITSELRIGQIPTWDSLSHMDLIFAIEEAFAVQFNGDEIADMVNVAAIRKLVASKVST